MTGGRNVEAEKHGGGPRLGICHDRRAGAPDGRTVQHAEILHGGGASALRAGGGAADAALPAGSVRRADRGDPRVARRRKDHPGDSQPARNVKECEKIECE